MRWSLLCALFRSSTCTYQLSHVQGEGRSDETLDAFESSGRIINCS